MLLGVEALVEQRHVHEALGAIREQPWVHKGKVRARWLTTLALSFDHRLVDGAQGSRFLSDVARIVEDPRNALLL